VASAITYRTGASGRDLRTVIVRDPRECDVLLPGRERMRVILGELLEGTASAHSWWAEQLGLDPESHDFVCPADQVVAQRELAAPIRCKRGKTAQ
jgi:hypothetical protein